MRTVLFVIWLSLGVIVSSQAGSVTDLTKVESITFNQEDSYLGDSYLSVILYGKIEDTDNLKIFTINSIPVKIYNKKFAHRVYLRKGKQPLYINVNNEKKTFVAEPKDVSEKDIRSLKIEELNEFFIKRSFNSQDQLIAGNPYPIYLIGEDYEKNKNFEMAKVMYQEALYFDEYFTLANLGMARYYLQDKNKDLHESIKYCRLASQYNYNDVFDITDKIKEIYNEIMKDPKIYAEAYLSRVLFFPSAIIKERIDDILKKQQKPEAMLAAACLYSIFPKGVPTLVQGSDEVYTEKIDQMLSNSQDSNVQKTLGDMHSMIASYLYGNNSDEAKKHYNIALACYYKSTSWDKAEKNKDSEDKELVYYESIIQLHKDPDDKRKEALIGAAERLLKGKDRTKATPYLREALLYGDDKNIKEKLDNTYKELGGQ